MRTLSNPTGESFADLKRYVDSEMSVPVEEMRPGQLYDALDRPLSKDWLRLCAQAREARLMGEKKHEL